MINNQNIKKIIVFILTIIIVLVISFSNIFLSEHAAHHCDGHDCPICEIMLQCSNTIKTIGSAIIIIFSGSLFSFSVSIDLSNDINICLWNSLISQRVRMNN